jgi:hypothetical protein
MVPYMETTYKVHTFYLAQHGNKIELDFHAMLFLFILLQYFIRS